MKFTDDDLERLKEDSKRTWSCGCTMCHLYYEPMLRQMPLLLARLEAAEACAELTYFHFAGQKSNLTPMVIELKDSAEAWYKATGKDKL